MTYKQIKNDARFLSIGINGNKKLVNNDSLRFIVWNIPAITTCPYATNHCKKACYAIKAEKAYPNTKKQRTRNFSDTLKPDFVDRMIFSIDGELSTNKFKNKKIVFRIHESGDFYNQEYANKWLSICKHYESNKNIVFMAYTKSLVYFKGVDIPKNMVIRASVWDDSTNEFLSLVKEMGLPIYTAVESFKGFKGTKCRCDDCANCGYCWNKSKKLIACEIH